MEFSAADQDDAGSSWPAGTRVVRSQERFRPAGSRPGHPELWTATRCPVCEEAGLFLLYPADAEAARDAANACRVSDRAGSAGGRQRRDFVLHLLQDRW